MNTSHIDQSSSSSVQAANLNRALYLHISYTFLSTHALSSLFPLSPITSKLPMTYPEYIPHSHFASLKTTPYPMAFKKFASLIVARRLTRIALVNSSLASAACTAPCIEPSPAGKSIVCSYSGILGTRSSGFMACSLRSRFAARRRCFLDFAGREHVSYMEEEGIMRQ